MTHKSHYRHRALRFALGRWLHKPPFTREHGIEVGRLEDLVDLDRLRRPLEFDIVRLAILLQPDGGRWRVSDTAQQKPERRAYWSNIFFT